MRGFVRTTAAAVAVALLLSPIAVAWSSFGSYEPDTVLDTPDFMWEMPGPGTADHVYFNAWASTFGVVNANAGALESAMETPTLERHRAILGVWVDCNGDGYVGLGESAAYEYRSDLLLDDSICPPVSGSPNNWVEGAHNYNGWVSELIPIAGPHDDDQTDQRVYRDSEARVWGDYGRPEDSTDVSGAGTCALTPAPRGTWATTGALINYLECPTGLLERWNTVWTLAGDPLGLAVPDDDDARGSALDLELFGSDSTEHAAVSVFPCDAPPAFDSAETANQTGVASVVDGALVSAETATGLSFNEGWEYYGFSVPAVSPETMNTGDPTVPGQTNQTMEEGLQDCDTSNDRGADFYELLNEGDFNSNPVRGKHEADWNFGYNEASRGSLPFNLAPSGSSGPAGALPGYGLGSGAVWAYSSWSSSSSLVKYGPNTAGVRTGLDPEDPTNANPGVDVDGGYWLTFYARVGPAVSGAMRLPGGVGVYGGPQCGDATSGIVNGWDCDPDHWNLNADGTLLPDRELLALPGDAYNLRDVDCYDGSTNAGVGAGLPYYGNDPCPRP